MPFLWLTSIIDLSTHQLWKYGSGDRLLAYGFSCERHSGFYSWEKKEFMLLFWPQRGSSRHLHEKGGTFDKHFFSFKPLDLSLASFGLTVRLFQWTLSHSGNDSSNREMTHLSYLASLLHSQECCPANIAEEFEVFKILWNGTSFQSNLFLLS